MNTVYRSKIILILMRIKLLPIEYTIYGYICRYRKLALKFHPDKNKSPDAEEKFKEISESEFKQATLMIYFTMFILYA